MKFGIAHLAWLTILLLFPHILSCCSQQQPGNIGFKKKPPVEKDSRVEISQIPSWPLSPQPLVKKTASSRGEKVPAETDQGKHWTSYQPNAQTCNDFKLSMI